MKAIASVDLDRHDADRVDELFPQRAHLDREATHMMNVDMVRFTWFIGEDVIAPVQAAPALRKGYVAFWQEPNFAQEMFGDPEPYAPAAIRTVEAFLGVGR